MDEAGIAVALLRDCGVTFTNVIDRDGKVVDGFYDFDGERARAALKKAGVE